MAVDGEGALETFARHRPDLIVLDLGLPGIDGLEVIRRVREQAQTPILVLSARGGRAGQGAGARPGRGRLPDQALRGGRAARPGAGGPAPRRADRRPGRTAVFRTADGDLEVDLEHRRVLARGEAVHLRPTEYELLKAFIAHPDKVLTHRWLLQRVWGPEYGSEGHYLHVYVAALRKKLEADPQRPRRILTEPGVGYRFRAD